ncbi:MAG: glycogen synthase GlgA [Deltaproteobacteria bacterium]
MKALFISPEMEPLAKVGGLGDVVGALPGNLSNRGCDARVVLPLYRQVKEVLKKLRLASKPVADVAVSIDSLVVRGRVNEVNLDGVAVYLLENDALFDRDDIYSSPQGDYADNDLRFGFLSLGALEIAKTLDFKPDIIHCHDWQTALAPISLRRRKHLRDDSYFRDTKIVFTIHNLAYQGHFGREILDKFSIDQSSFTPEELEFYGKVNLLKGGILYSDAVTAVSPTYAEEIKTPEGGCGLDGALRGFSSAHPGKLVGILNGIDCESWNPETDKSLWNNYGASNISLKNQNKVRFQGDQGLKIDPLRPLAAVVSRLVEQKGIDLIIDALPEIFALGCQVVVLGSGEERFERALEDASGFYKGNFVRISGFSDEMARRVYAASDIFLMPSRFEPCGLGQMIALRYGSVPVVRHTGGLRDTIRDYTENTRTGNGFVFREFSKSDFLSALSRALRVFGKPREWRRLAESGMREDFSWEASSRSYIGLYQRV